MQANKSPDNMQNLHYFVVANLPKEHDKLFFALMHNSLMNVVSTSVVTTSRALSTGKISARGVKGEEPKIESRTDFKIYRAIWSQLHTKPIVQNMFRVANMMASTNITKASK